MGCGESKPVDEARMSPTPSSPGSPDGRPSQPQPQLPPPKPPRRKPINEVGDRVLVDGGTFELRKLLHHGCSTVWEAEGGGWGVVVLKVCDHGRAESKGENGRRKSNAALSREPFVSELKVRKALGGNAAPSTIRVIASDPENHVLVLERAECSLDGFLEQQAAELRAAAEREQLDTQGGSKRQAHLAKDLPLLLAPLRSLHAANWCHLDIKPGNYLHMMSGGWKLADLDSCKKAGKRGEAFTTQYAAPEVACAWEKEGELPPAKTSMDIFSLGLICYQVLTFQMMLPAADDAAMALLTGPKAELEKVVASGLKNIEGPLREVIGGMLQYDPAKRPTALQLETTLRVASPASVRSSATRI